MPKMSQTIPTQAGGELASFDWARLAADAALSAVGASAVPDGGEHSTKPQINGSAIATMHFLPPTGTWMPFIACPLVRSAPVRLLSQDIPLAILAIIDHTSKSRESESVVLFIVPYRDAALGATSHP